MVHPIIESPSGSLKISPPAAQFISAMGQDIVKCSMMQSCMTMLGMTHMTWWSCKKYLQENGNKMMEMGQQQSPWQKCRISCSWISPRLRLIISRFYQLIQGMKCKKSSCNGVPILRALKAVIISVVNLLLPTWLIYFLGKAPYVHGKNHFIGCTCWRQVRILNTFTHQFQLQLMKQFYSNSWTMILLPLMRLDSMKGLVFHSTILDMASRKSVVSNHLKYGFFLWRLTMTSQY